MENQISPELKPPEQAPPKLAKQFPNGFAIIDQGQRPVERVAKYGRARIDPEVMIDRGRDVLWGDGALNDVLAARTGATDGLPHLHAAATHDDAKRVAPVVAAGIGVHSRRA